MFVDGNVSADVRLVGGGTDQETAWFNSVEAWLQFSAEVSNFGFSFLFV